MAKKYKGLSKSSLRPSEAKKRSSKLAKAASERYKKGSLSSTSAKSTSKKPATGSKGRTVKLMPLRENVVPQPPETSLTRVGMSISKLLRNTPALMHANAEEVQVLSYKKLKTKSGLPAIKAIVIHKDPWRPDRIKKKREVYLIGLSSQKTPISRQKKVMVSCNCENWTFTWEYACAVHGCAKVLYGNGEPPIYTNPGLVPGLCKHITAIAMAAKLRGD